MATIEQSVNVSNTTDSLVIDDLMNNMEYQFQVVTIAEFDRDVVIGQRCTVSEILVEFEPTTTTVPTTTTELGITVV